MLKLDEKIYSNSDYAELIAYSTWYSSFIRKVVEIFGRPSEELEKIQKNQLKRIKPKLFYVENQEFASTFFYDLHDRPYDEFLLAFGLWSAEDFGSGIYLYKLKKEFQGNFGNCIVISKVFLIL